MVNLLLKNIAAVFNYQKQGYVCEAILKNHKVSKTNERYDVGIFSITKKNGKIETTNESRNINE